MSVDGPISPKQCYYEMDYSFYSFYWLDSLEIWLDHNSAYYHSLSKNSDVKPHISHCDPKTPNISRTPSFDLFTDEFSKRVYYKTRLILENWWYLQCYCTTFWLWCLSDNGIDNFVFSMLTSWHGNVFYITGLWWKSTSHWWIPLTDGQWFRRFDVFSRFKIFIVSTVPHKW